MSGCAGDAGHSRPTSIVRRSRHLVSPHPQEPPCVQPHHTHDRRDRRLPAPGVRARNRHAAAAAGGDRLPRTRGNADLPRAGATHTHAGGSRRRTTRDRGRRVHGLRRAVRRPRPARGRRARRLRRERGVDGHRPALLGGGGSGFEDSTPSRAGARNPRRPRPRRTQGCVRHRVHRRGQGELRGVLRAVPRAAPPGRTGAGRQRALERGGGRRERPLGGHRGAARLQRQARRRYAHHQ